MCVSLRYREPKKLRLTYVFRTDLPNGPNSLQQHARRNQVSTSVLWAAVGTVAALAAPLAYAQIVAAIIDPASPPSRLSRAVAVLGASYAVEPAATYLYVKAMSGVIDRAASRLKLEAFRSLLSQEVAFFDMAGSSEVRASFGVCV